MGISSRIPGFYKKSLEERLSIIAELVGLTEEEVDALRNFGNLGKDIADIMIENVVGGMTYPFAIATNFRVNGRDLLVPMVIEESSVVAAASNAARVMREGDGIISRATRSIMIGQVQLVDVPNPYYVKQVLYEHKDDILAIANEQDSVLVGLGGGAKDIDVRIIETSLGFMVILHLLVDVKDAMGANAVNTMVEAVAPYIVEWTGGKVYLRIISNLADKRLVRSRVTVYARDIGGEEAVNGIVAASAFAEADPYRAATHNKGIMNGVIAVALATGQDHRALEAGAHSYAARWGIYTSLSEWEKTPDGDLVGTLEMPMAVGIVGGAVKVHPIARIALKILGVDTASELAEVMGAVGLAQNFAALRALATEGIQKGHMKLHARNLAVMAGANGELIDKIAEEMIRQGKIRFENAKRLLEEYTKSKRV
jgi:hydroxymethylglutaryl-CoA reductase